MNENKIIVSQFSNEESHQRYKAGWPGEPDCQSLYENGSQCGGCSFFAAFDTDWGLCCHEKSRHFTETVFEHFTCGKFVNECWGPHSFTENKDCHCRCHGEGDDFQ